MPKTSPHLFGAHTPDTGGIDMAARRAGRAGMKALQIFTTIPKFYGDKASIRPERVTRFKAALADVGIEPQHVVVHAAYVLNTATHEPDKWVRAAAGLAKELERSSALGVGGFCFHPGAARDGNREAALERVAKAITQALESTDSETRILVENTAGAGLTVGRTPEEVGGILSLVPSSLRKRAGYGLDTCHLHSAGHDLTSSAESLTAVLDAFESATGEPPSFFHLNDSEHPQGSNKDRHALIGEGTIGAEPFRWLLHDKRSRGIPLILETPQVDGEPAVNDDTPDELDVRMIKLLTSLAGD